MSEKKVKTDYEIWNSNSKRVMCSKFKCAFCGNVFRGSSYSIIDGGKSCVNCDGISDIKYVLRGTL